jgi:integrase
MDGHRMHPQNALSAAKVRALNAPGRYADGNGLYLVCDPSGAKRWVLRTVIKGKRCDLGLGGLSLVSLAEAREEALRLRKIARKGGDPLAERRQQLKPVPTFEEAAREVHREHSRGFRNAKHAAQWISTLEMYVFPVFGSRPVNGIESHDVLSALSPIWIEKPETARRTKQRIQTVFAWAKAKGYRTGDNPVEGVSEVLPKHNTKKAHHAALPYADLPAFILALRKSNAGELVKLAFEFLILTVTRTSECLFAKWSEIDLDGKAWAIPADRMKAHEEHRVPLSQRCLKLLSAARELGGDSEYVFPGRNANQPLSNMVFEMALRRMGRDDVVPHGFRSSFRDWAEEKTSFKRSVIEAALAHKVRDKVEAAYHRTKQFEQRIPLMAAWAQFATAAPKAKVVNISREG